MTASKERIMWRVPASCSDTPVFEKSADTCRVGLAESIGLLSCKPVCRVGKCVPFQKSDSTITARWELQKKGSYPPSSRMGKRIIGWVDPQSGSFFALLIVSRRNHM